MAVIENSLQFRKKIVLVEKIWVPPVYGVSGRCLKTAFLGGCHLFIRNEAAVLRETACRTVSR